MAQENSSTAEESAVLEPNAEPNGDPTAEDITTVDTDINASDELLGHVVHEQEVVPDTCSKSEEAPTAPAQVFDDPSEEVEVCSAVPFNVEGSAPQYPSTASDECVDISNEAAEEQYSAQATVEAELSEATDEGMLFYQKMHFFWL